MHLARHACAVRGRLRRMRARRSAGRQPPMLQEGDFPRSRRVCVMRTYVDIHKEKRDEKGPRLPGEERKRK